MNHFNRTKRRSVLLSVVATLLPTALIAAPPQQDDIDDSVAPDGVVFGQLQRLLRPALYDLQAGQLFNALSAIEKARELLTQSEKRNWPFWLYVNQPYGLALIRLGRAQEAIAPLRLAIETEQRIRNSSSVTLKALINSLDAGLVRVLMDMEFKRQAVSQMETNGRQPRTVKELLLDQSPGTADIYELLVHAYAKTEQFDKASAILDAQIDRAQLVDLKADSIPISLEYRLFKMGASLGGHSDKLNAGKAIDAALKLNFIRLQKYTQHALLPDSSLALYAVRRLQLSAMLGNANLNDLDSQGRLSVAYRILETKGLGVRYAERLHQLVQSSKSPEAQATRSKLEQIEKRFSDGSNDQVLPLTYLEYSLERFKAIAPLMPDLVERGLGVVFRDGAVLLNHTRNVIGDGAYIGYMAYTPLAADKFAFGATRYLRFCITSADIQLTDVGSKNVVDKAVYSWRLRILNREPAGQLAAELTRLLLSDLPAAVKEAKNWTIEPDGALNLVPFEALLAPDGNLLISKVDIGYITSTGQLREPSPSKRTGIARIIADPEFTKEKNKGPIGVDVSRSSSSMVVKGRPMEPLYLTPLPESRLEATAVESALRRLGMDAETFLGTQADIHSLEMAHSPRILHVATHGVLLPPPLLPQQQDSDPLTQVESISLTLPGRNAGLVVAGAYGPEIVYASDIALLPLGNTELVVLSACDSGNGTIDVGEGLASLRRAVETAGAQSSITSLWAVPSTKTTELMASFYGYLAEGRGKRASLRQAKLDAIASNSNPYTWAGFVFSGND